MSAAHTPGPWTLNEVDEFDHNDHAATETWVYDSNADRLLARVIGDKKGRCENARLIAAAPELLFAAEALVAYLGRCSNDPLNPCWDNRPTDRVGMHWGSGHACAYCSARGAIAKAVQS